MSSTDTKIHEFLDLLKVIDEKIDLLAFAIQGSMVEPEKQKKTRTKAESKVVESKAPESKVVETKTPETKTPESKTPNTRLRFIADYTADTNSIRSKFVTDEDIKGVAPPKKGKHTDKQIATAVWKGFDKKKHNTIKEFYKTLDTPGALPVVCSTPVESDEDDE